MWKQWWPCGKTSSKNAGECEEREGRAGGAEEPEVCVCARTRRRLWPRRFTWTSGCCCCCWPAGKHRRWSERVSPSLLFSNSVCLSFSDLIQMHFNNVAWKFRYKGVLPQWLYRCKQQVYYDINETLHLDVTGYVIPTLFLWIYFKGHRCLCKAHSTNQNDSTMICIQEIHCVRSVLGSPTPSIKMQNIKWHVNVSWTYIKE